MRVTDQILNATARRAGVPINMPLTDYLNKSYGNSLLEALGKKNEVVDTGKKKSYEKLEKTAEQLSQAAEAFLAEGQDSMFAKAKESGDKEEIYSHVEKMLEQYNNTMKALKSTATPLNQYYRQKLQEAAGANRESLKNAGITIDQNGVMKVDKTKLQETDLESLENLFGASGDFSKKMSYLGERIADNAGENAKSYSSQYNAQGSNFYGFYANKYDFWG